MQKISALLVVAAMFGTTGCCAQAAAAERATLPIPPSGVIGVTEAMLSPDFWIARAATPDKLLMTRQQIEALNSKTLAKDTMMHDLSKVAASVSREQVQAWLKESAEPPKATLVDATGNTISKAALDAVLTNMSADSIPASQATRYGLSVRRAQMRLFPTTLKAFPSKELLDFESFQGGTLFPGEAVIIAHTSADGQWLFVICMHDLGWVARTDIAEGSAQQVFGYVNRQPFRVVTGDRVHTVFTPETPEVSELTLDMGTRVPLTKLPEDQPVNGQGPYVSWTLELPVRREDGSLAFKPALLQKIKDTAPTYLPLTRANIIRQSFKFLGERYGWGHLYNARDCSGFTSDVYSSMGIFMPPNANGQGRGPAFRHRLFTAQDSHQARVQALRDAQIGDLVVVPGHVLMILGHVNGEPYVIQDVPYAVFYDATGKLRKTKVNGVSVTPLLPLMADDKQSYADAMTSLVHVTAPLEN